MGPPGLYCPKSQRYASKRYNENGFLPLDFRRGTNPADYGNAIAEYQLFFSLGVDGMFSDDSDTAVLARELWEDAGSPHRAAA
jgi:hypothetical protein